MNARLITTIFLAILAGCATTQFEEGKKLIEQGFTEEGLAKLELAAREKPHDPEIRNRLMRERELAGMRLTELGASARLQSRLDDADAAYARALRLNPDNQRAQAGLAAIAADRRHPQMVREAEAMFAMNDLSGAETKLRTILAENPNQSDARNLLRRIGDAVAVRSSASPVLKAAVGKQINLEFRDASLKQVFDMVSRTAGINFVFDKDVRPDIKATIVIQNATVDDVIKLILTTNQLERKVLNDNTMLVYPNTAAKIKEYQELMVRSFYIANADVTKTLAMIKAVVKTRDTFVDEKLNLLVIRDTPEAVRLAEKLIAAQDLADPEVTLDVEVLEVGSSLLQTIGPQFPTSVNFQDPATVAGGASVGATAVATMQRFSGPLVGFIATPAVILNLKQQDGLTNVLANPRIRVKNREKAKIHIGDRVPVVTTTATANVGVASSVNYLDVGLKLEVEPSIRIENDVDIKVALEVSTITKEVALTSGGLAYQIGTRNASTVLRLHDGETQVLAGLIQDEDRSTASKLPGLGDLPLLGRLFGSNNVTRSKTEIVLLITPHIARNIARPEYAVAEFLSGTEAAVGAPPLIVRSAAMGGLALSTALASPPAPRPTSTPLNATAPLVVSWSGPPQTQIGKDLTLSINLGADARLVGAQIQLGYDPAVLAPATSAGQAKEPGTLIVSLGAPGGVFNPVVQVPFQVIAKTALASHVSMERLALRDGEGNNLQAVAPAPYTVIIVP
jgi:general secretion pathway protein D